MSHINPSARFFLPPPAKEFGRRVVQLIV